MNSRAVRDRWRLVMRRLPSPSDASEGPFVGDAATGRGGLDPIFASGGGRNDRQFEEQGPWRAREGGLVDRFEDFMRKS